MKFEFFIGIIALYSLLHPLSGITQKLQGRAIDVVYPYNNIQEFIKNLRYIRKAVEKALMADNLYVERVIPRTVFTRQANCNNVPAELLQEYYKRVLIISLFDNIVSETKL